MTSFNDRIWGYPEGVMGAKWGFSGIPSNNKDRSVNGSQKPFFLGFLMNP